MQLQLQRYILFASQIFTHRKILIALLEKLTLLLIGCSKKQITNQQSKDNEESYVNIVDKDLEVLERCMTDDIILTHITGATQTKDEWLNCIENETMRYFSIEVLDFKIEIQENTAIMEHTSRLDARIYGSRGS